MLHGDGARSCYGSYDSGMMGHSMHQHLPHHGTGCDGRLHTRCGVGGGFQYT